MMNRQRRKGFTLVELLIVVFIIGVLTAVVLPEYKKSVRKARLSEVSTTFKTLSEGIDMWLMSTRRYPASTIFFSGTNKGALLDVSPMCDSEDTNYCYTKVGRWGYGCNNTHCEISLSTSYKPDGSSSGNEWLEGSQVVWFKTGEGPWGLAGSQVQSSVRKEICLWWKGLYGAEKMLKSDDTFDDACSTYF